jgi:hypothetical protein
MTYLEKLTASLSPTQQTEVIGVLRECDIARLMRKTSINQELKRVAKSARQSGRVKRLILALSKHPDTIDGVDFLFENGVLSND